VAAVVSAALAAAATASATVIADPGPTGPVAMTRRQVSRRRSDEHDLSRGPQALLPSAQDLPLFGSQRAKDRL
jgi:hypothetical protein